MALVDVTCEKGELLGAFQVACFGLFVVIFVSRTLSLLICRRINPITFDLRKRGLLGVVEFAFFAQVNVLGLSVVAYSLPPGVRPVPWLFGPQLVDSIAAKVVGVGLIVLAFVLFVLALISLGSSWRLGMDEKNPGPLTTTGIYALTRNPIYLFFDLYFIGTFLINGALIFGVFAALAVANLHYQILQEERILARIYGAAYVAYCERTARYFNWRRFGGKEVI